MRVLLGSIVVAGFLVVACGTDSSTAAPGDADAAAGCTEGVDCPKKEPSCTEPGECAECKTKDECAAPSNTCQVAACNAGACAIVDAPDDTACDDGDKCSTGSVCKAGACAAGVPVTCAAQDACHEAGVCDPQSGACSNPAKAESTACGEARLCKLGTCTDAVVVLAKQDFEESPASPTWSFAGSPTHMSGTSSASASPASSPLGIGGSRAWATTAVGAGVALEFDNVTVPAGFDAVRLRFRLAAMNTLSASGGPDNLDYVLVAISTDGGTTFYDRLRIRGATTDNSVWAYDATGVASVAHLPATETTFQPTSSGVQTSMGYSAVEITFPGTVTQVKTRITARSSSSTDTWLIDDLALTGEYQLPSEP